MVGEAKLSPEVEKALTDLLLGYERQKEETVRQTNCLQPSDGSSIRTIGDWLSYANEHKVDPRRVFTPIRNGVVSIEVRSKKWLERKLELESIEYF